MAYSFTHATMGHFHSFTHATHLIYHTYRLSFEPALTTKDGAASPLSERQQQSSVTVFLIEKFYIQINQAARRIGRVAKQISIALIRVLWLLSSALAQSITYPAKPLPKLTTNIEQEWKDRTRRSWIKSISEGAALLNILRT